MSAGFHFSIAALASLSDQNLSADGPWTLQLFTIEE